MNTWQLGRSHTGVCGAFYVMDRGSVDVSRLYALHQAGTFFVTRAKSSKDTRRVYSTATDRTSGVICD